MRFVTVLTILIFSSCTGCQTTKKRDSALQSADASTAPSKAESTPAPSTNTYDEPITYLSIQSAADGYAITIRTELELFCERLCSDFHLVEDNVDGVLTYRATRTPVPGNVQPGRLMEDRAPNIKSAKIKKIVVKNVGKAGNDLVVSDVMTAGKTLFYAVSARVTPAMAIGGESSGYSVAFEGKTMDAKFDDQKLATQVGVKPMNVFVTGYVATESKVERGDVPVFHVVTMEPGS